VKLTPKKVREVIQQVKRRPTSLDTKLQSDSDATVLDLVVDDSTRIEAALVTGMLRTDLGALMRRNLRTEEMRVLTLRFGLEDGTARTIRQVAEETGMPYATAKHVLFGAMSKMRKPHVAIALRDYLTNPDDES